MCLSFEIILYINLHVKKEHSIIREWCYQRVRGSLFKNACNIDLLTSCTFSPFVRWNSECNSKLGSSSRTVGAGVGETGHSLFLFIG